MKTLWQKSAPLDEEIAAFTVGEDRTLDAFLATFDVLGSIAHVAVLREAQVLSNTDADALTHTLCELYESADRGELKPELCDEDIHSALERVLTERLGDAGRRVHTARSRNDQVATDVALYLLEHTAHAHAEVLQCVEKLLDFASRFATLPLPGMTHTQPAMPSTFGHWASGFASLLLDDAAALQHAHSQASSNPLGSAAGYGVPPDLVALQRSISTHLLGFERTTHAVTAVQTGRGKPESHTLFALSQTMTTCARMCRDLVLAMHPSFGFFDLPDHFMTGSSIMPQKRNPDVLELARGSCQNVHAALHEVMGLSASLSSGYHRDFQLLKAPLMRGVHTARSVLRILTHVLTHLTPKPTAAKAACSPDLLATYRALQLVRDGIPFRQAYAQVAQEVSTGSLPTLDTHDSTPPMQPVLKALQGRLDAAHTWAENHPPLTLHTLLQRLETLHTHQETL